jgi:hypothetical protein
MIVLYRPLSAGHCVFSKAAPGRKLLTQRKAQLRSVELGLIINLAEARKFTQVLFLLAWIIGRICISNAPGSSGN